MNGHLRVLSIYEGFFSGGARMLHSDVLSGLHGRRGQQHSVLSIHAEVRRESTFQPMREDACYRRLVADGLDVLSLERTADDQSPFAEAEIALAARLARQADIVLTLKEQPLRLVNRAGLRDRPVIACLHRSDPENQGSALDELLAAAGSGQLAAAVCCAESTRDAYAGAGIPEQLLHVIPNGVDLRRFKPNRRARAAVRAAAGIPAEAEVVVFAARYDEMKNVPLFLAAAREFIARRPEGHVLMCGAGMSTANPGLLRDLAAVGLGAADVSDVALAGAGRAGRRGAPRPNTARVHLLGVRPDPESVFAAADVVALTSAFGEAAPLCLIEGMLCGAVPVATDVGDCAAIVAGHGLITPPEASGVVEGWLEALEAGPHFRLAVSRNRYRFGRARMIGAYGTLIRRTHRRSHTVLPSAEIARPAPVPALAIAPALPAPAGAAVSASAVP
ncbi:glycosyltransferase [Actinospica durhamensis]|uniref:Glycosyltransferase n=1 Tax=Actinospica durhamensis TaxID=1508375 RepID=A0A941EZQ8_9ACTN|nr:glycosyltransferase [Actinospica durhamensis]MBR7837289.1 glycosyltransferase [Actinospica durhamensis]